MRDRGGRDHPRGLEPDRIDPEPVEQRSTVTEEHGGEVDLDLVEQPSLQVLLDDGGTAGQ